MYMSANLVGQNCLTGMSVIIKKGIIDDIGGLEALAVYLAEDFFMGKAIVDRSEILHSCHITGNFRELQTIRENIICECCADVLFFVDKERAKALIRENNNYLRNALSRAFAKIFSCKIFPLYGSSVLHFFNLRCLHQIMPMI